MKKYDIPQMEIIHFLTEIFVASSGETPSRSYISEIGYLEATLTSAQHQKRMADFGDVLEFN